MKEHNGTQHIGTLTVEQVAEGIDRCVENASNLLEEATLLSKHGRHARAFSLTVLAEEEMGKIPILAKAIWFKPENNVQWRKLWRRFRTHEAKYRDTLGLDFLFLPEKELEDTIKEMETIPPEINFLKQLGFYVDFVNGYFTIPNALFQQDFVEFMLRVANGRLNVLKKLHSDGRTLRALMRMLKRSEELGLKGPPKTIEEYIRFWMKDTGNEVDHVL